MLNEKNSKLKSIAPISYEPAWPKNEEFTQYPTEPSFKIQEEIIKDISGWYKKNLPDFGLGDASGSAVINKEEKKEEKKATVAREV